MALSPIQHDEFESIRCHQRLRLASVQRQQAIRIYDLRLRSVRRIAATEHLRHEEERLVSH